MPASPVTRCRAISWVAQLLAGNSFVSYLGLEYVIFALAIGLLISNVFGVPRWLQEAVRTEFYIKTGLVLLGAGYLPVIIHATDRQRYYDSFRLPEGMLRDLTMEAIENGLAHAEKVFASVQPGRTRRTAR